MTTAPALANFDDKRPVDIHPDASGYAISAVVVCRDFDDQKIVVAREICKLLRFIR